MSFAQSYLDAVPGAGVAVQAAPFPDPQVLRWNAGLGAQLGLAPDAELLTGGQGGTALAYSGHQFGGFSPVLGDGRAMLLGETQGLDVHLKGSGPTPFARRGDGRAVLGPVLREYLMGEAMHALGVPTTRGLAVCTTGERVMRDGPEPGAVLARVAASHIRVGTFQYFAARGDVAGLRALADYAAARHYPGAGVVELLCAVRDAQIALVARWVSLGFVHGVMNTDNMTISGETIDYGPCAFVDRYAPGAVFSSIDRSGRYAFGNQPVVAQWNLARLAEALAPLVTDPDPLIEAVSAVPALYQQAWLNRMRAKLGLMRQQPDDLDLANGLFRVIEGADFTGTMRSLSDVVRGGDAALDDAWLSAYRARLGAEDTSPEARADAMDRVNPLYIPRNHLVEDALSAANQGDLAHFDQLAGVLAQPFTAQNGADRYALPAPENAPPHVTFCGT